MKQGKLSKAQIEGIVDRNLEEALEDGKRSSIEFAIRSAIIEALSYDPWIYLSDTNNPVNRSEELIEGTYVIQTVYGDMWLTKYEPRIDCFALLNKSISAIPGNEVYACLPIEKPQKET